jgi:hypothetical protein
MIPDRDDPILDACLDEVLAGRSPPDLTARILQAWKTGEARQADLPGPPPILASLPQALDDASIILPLVERRGGVGGREPRRKSSSASLAIGLAAGVIGLGIAVGIIALLRSSGPQIAHSPQATPAKGPSSARDIAATPKVATPKTDSKASAPEELVPNRQLVQQPGICRSIQSFESSSLARPLSSA